MKERAGQGFGVKVTQAHFISEEQENYLWEQGLLGSSNGCCFRHSVCFKGWSRAQK